MKQVFFNYIKCGLLFVAGYVSQSISLAQDVSPVTGSVWKEAVASVTDLDRSAEFFVSIGGYEVKWRGKVDASGIRSWGLPATVSAEAMLLGPPGTETGLLRLIRFNNAGQKLPTRPGARAWDTGCYFSLMVRMKDMGAIYHDAIAMGWWTETPMTYLEFGTSKLNVMVFRGPDGVQVQGYERLSPPLPAEIPDFERLTNPFNIMQMVRNRDDAYAFFTSVLGFNTFHHGKPYRDQEPTYMPLGIPYNLTTSIPYKASIVYPVKGEFGRMEMIEIDGLDGHDYADQCDAPNLGILAVRFPVDNAMQAVKLLEERGGVITRHIQRITLMPYGDMNIFTIKSPDGSNIQFYELLSQ